LISGVKLETLTAISLICPTAVTDNISGFSIIK
jgi:hypothetical protein